LLQAHTGGGGGGGEKCPNNFRGAWEKALSDSHLISNSLFFVQGSEKFAGRISQSIRCPFDLLP